MIIDLLESLFVASFLSAVVCPDVWNKLQGTFVLKKKKNQFKIK